MNELETQAQEELNAMMSGTNDIETTEPEEIETDDEPSEVEIDEEIVDDSSEEDSESDEEESKPKNKTEEKFKKILSDKNSYKTKAEEALAKVNELTDKLADKDFYWDRPQAKKFADEIQSIREANPNLSREDAFNMIAGRENLSAKPKGLIGKPKSPEAVKSTKDMDSEELQEAFEATWGLDALLK